MARILLVDDDVDAAQTVADLLIFEKYEVDLAHTGMEGWQKAQSNQYDLLILDWDLPDLNGINILSRFRKAGFTAPVIMLTGHGSVSDKELGLDCGADDYVTKPFDLDELMARIRAVLRRAEAQKPVFKALGTGNQDVLKLGNLDGTSLASRYEFLEVIGEGGIGVVFKARQPMIEKLVAIKMINSQESGEESVARFTREAKAVSRLDHTNIIVIHDFGVTENGHPFMVMDYIEGWNLGDVIRQQGAFPLDFAVSMAIQICDGIAHAHANGILHRDLKPANVLLKRNDDREPVVKIVDFGLAKMLDQKDSKDAPALTKHGQVFGSPMYMSPEQVQALPVDERTDVYSVGCIIYEMFTGCPPHLADTSMAMMAKQLTEEPQPLNVLRSDLSYPPACQPLIDKVLAKKPENRYQSMGELKSALERLKADLKASASKSS
jgi:CheY-like chemotaxis protein/tRNA A-37 threonylcarbamoyl transferase component Bud32